MVTVAADLARIMAKVESRVPLQIPGPLDLGRILERVKGPETVLATARGPRGSVELLGDEGLRFSKPMRHFRDISLNFVDARREAGEGWIGFQVLAKKGVRGRAKAYGWLQAYPATFKKDEAHIPSDYPECEDDWKGLARRVGYSRLKLWFVGSTWLPPQLRGFGLGRLVYEQLLITAARRDAAIAPDRCGPFGSTSKAAMRVWDRLVAVHPHQGYVIVRTDLLGRR